MISDFGYLGILTKKSTLDFIMNQALKIMAAFSLLREMNITLGIREDVAALKATEKTKEFQKYFLKKKTSETIPITFGVEEKPIILITAINDKNFARNIANFIDEILGEKASFTNDNYSSAKKMVTNEIATNEKGTENLTGKEREAVIKCRINQSTFRDRVLELSPRCLFTKIQNKSLLIAGHIISWKACEYNKQDRLDPYNGFALTPTYDWLFDKHLISFDEKGKLHVSKSLTQDICKDLNLIAGKFYNIDNLEKRRKYLEHHYEYFKNKERTEVILA